MYSLDLFTEPILSQGYGAGPTSLDMESKTLTTGPKTMSRGQMWESLIVDLKCGCCHLIGGAADLSLVVVDVRQRQPIADLG